MDVIRLHRTSRILAGHLWVFSNELAASPKAHEPGVIVELRDRTDAFLGIGYVNPRSLIAVRILTREREEIDADFFRRRISEALAMRRRFFADTRTCRVVFSEGDFLPGLIVDRYDSCLSVQLLTLGMERQRETVLEALDSVFSPHVMVLRNDGGARSLEGLPREKAIVKGTLEPLPLIEEGDIRFEVNPYAGQKTGFFLDQRENRMRFSALAGGGRGLDLFSYAGAWTMHLAQRGASVTAVDESGDALRQAERNAELNDVKGRCAFVQADVFAFLERERAAGSRFDFIVLDPPAFVKSRAKTKAALRGYRELNARAMGMLNAGGLLASSSCSYHIDRETFLAMLRSAARDAGRTARLIELRSQGRDHPVLLSMPETEYLKCAFLEIR